MIKSIKKEKKGPGTTTDKHRFVCDGIAAAITKELQQTKENKTWVLKFSTERVH